MMGTRTDHRHRLRGPATPKVAVALALALFAALLSLPSAVTAQDRPTCSSAAVDPDGDGWGWEDGQSCIVDTSASTSTSASTGFGDAVSAATGTATGTVTGTGTGSGAYPVCTSAAADPDGDGWGWENSGTCTVDTAPTGPVTPARSKMVISMGDSYISGESGHLIGNNSAERRTNAYLDGTDVRSGADMNMCRRSDVAPIRSAAIPGVTAINIACSGATTEDIVGSGDGSTTGRFGERLQIDQLRDLAQGNDVEMVVVSIGGNDLGFVEFATACVARYAVGSTCSGQGAEADTYTKRLTGVMAPRVRATVSQIKQVLANAGQPDARIVLQSYPSAVPASTSYDGIQRLNHGCAFNNSDMGYINSTFVPLIDSTLAQIADDVDVDFLSLSNAFDGKEVCSPQVTSRDNTSDHAQLEWVTGIRVANATATPESLHPNALGQRALGRCLRMVWDNSDAYSKCHNNGNGPWDMRLGGSSTGTGTGDGAESDGGNNGGDDSVPACESRASDPDGDGWGWENGRSCLALLSAEDVDCKDVSGTEARVCELVLNRINEELDLARISVDQGGLLFTYEDPEDSRINTARCTTRAYVTHKKVTARIGSNSQLDIRGNAIDEPFAIRLSVPFDLSARVDGRSDLNWNFFGSCNDLGSDSYYATGNVSGTADVLVAFDFGADVDTNANGDLVITIEPKAHVAMDLNDPNLDLRVRGTNPIAQFYSFIASFTRTLSDGLEAGLSGDSVADAIEARGLDLGVPVALTLTEGITSTLLWDMVLNYGEREAQRAVQNIGADLENDLNAEIREALDIDETGIRTYVITGDFARLLQGGASLDDLLLAG